MLTLPCEQELNAPQSDKWLTDSEDRGRYMSTVDCTSRRCPPVV